MLKAKKNTIFEKLFSVYNTRLLKKHFFRIMLSGEENFLHRPGGKPTIIYANHSNWWDGLAAFYLSYTLWNIDAYVMMDIEQMKKYSFFKRVGAFSVNRANAREALESVFYAAELLKNTDRVLWIFPQGIMQPNDFRPVKFYGGISKIAQKLPGANLIPVTLRYEFLMEQRPEIFINVGKTRIYSPAEEGKDFIESLNLELVSELDKLKFKVITSELDGFKPVLHGMKSRNKTVDRIYRK